MQANNPIFHGAIHPISHSILLSMCHSYLHDRMFDLQTLQLDWSPQLIF